MKSHEIKREWVFYVHFGFKKYSVALTTFSVHELIHCSFAGEESRVLETSILYALTLVYFPKEDSFVLSMRKESCRGKQLHCHLIGGCIMK